MPLDKHNSMAANTTSLIFSLLDIGSGQDVPFGTPQYIQCILHGLTSVLLCVPFIIADSKKAVVLPPSHIFLSGYLDYRGSFRLGL